MSDRQLHSVLKPVGDATAEQRSVPEPHSRCPAGTGQPDPEEDLQRRLLEAREAFAAAQERAAEHERINTVLRTISHELARARSPQEIFDIFLLRAVEAVKGTAGGLLKRLTGTAHEFVSLVENGTVVPRADWTAEPILTESAEITGRDAAGMIARVAAGEQVWLQIDDAFAKWAPGSAEFQRRQGNKASVLEPFFIDGKMAGYLGIAFTHLSPPSQSQRETLKALGEQASLALELNAMHARLEETIVAREREAAAQERAAELTKANAMLRAAARDLVQASHPEDILAIFLKSAIKAANATGGAILRRTGETEFTFVTILEDGVLLRGDELAAHSLTAEVKQKSRLDPSGYFARLAAGETVWRLAGSKAEQLNAIQRWHEQLRNRALWDIPFRIGAEVGGYLGLAFQHEEGPSDIVRETIGARRLPTRLPSRSN